MKKSGIVKIFLLLAVVVLIAVFVSMHFVEKQRVEVITKPLDEALEEGLVEKNKELPKEIAPHVVLEEVSKEGKTIYQLHTLKNIVSTSVNPEDIKQDEIGMLSKFCNLKEQKELILAGYTFVFVYNTSDKKNAFQIVIDKNACAKYTKI